MRRRRLAILPPQQLGERVAQTRRRGRNFDAAGFHGRNLAFGIAPTTGDDGAGVPHATTGRGRASGEKLFPGMMPILHSPAVITPGQLGPINRDFPPESARLTLTMSSTGMPSVMHTMRGISAWIDSQIA